MTPPVQPESELQKLAADFKAFVHWAELKLHLIHQTVDPSVAAQPVSTVPPSTTTTFGGTEPAGTVGDAQAVPTVNGVPVPSGMTLESFTQLVGAVQGVNAQLDPSNDPSVLSALVTMNPTQWAAYGDYYREAFLHQATRVALTTVRNLSQIEGAPALLSVTADQWTAANQAAGK